jgi:hypothetical protein
MVTRTPLHVTLYVQKCILFIFAQMIGQNNVGNEDEIYKWNGAKDAETCEDVKLLELLELELK